MPTLLPHHQSKILWQTLFPLRQKTQQQKLPFLPLGVQQQILVLMIQKVLRQTLPWEHLDDQSHQAQQIFNA
jgi:hypothetical protein